ncbi:endo alpha-1,4 polygalactosaminidase [Hydrogenimonas sp.]|uniref:endo alpha-1,4 polygalactosaminidase n=1 Tax=Hydrogenimonas sp. TaxID=2231112 RepID=UPI00261081CA|nr:endo alpha-1,4 polygalactosaminidase [Hydrogenimonas sp.]
MKRRFIVIYGVAALLFYGCGGSGGGVSDETEEVTRSTRSYSLHKDITATVFWIGESASPANGNISNVSSTWDEKWTERFGGIDTPDRRNGYFPQEFRPRENPFYAALPYNDFDENGSRKPGLDGLIPWYTPGWPEWRSFCKNRWIKIEKDGKTVYAQWEDSGPFGENDADYVFADALPLNTLNDRAGIDVSPAVRDYLGLQDIDKVDWRFVDDGAVPNGPWKTIVTASGVGWPLWYRPDTNVSWQWQLNGQVDTGYDVELYDIDLFDSDENLIRDLKNDGKRVICYFSAGSYENWRDDKDLFPSEVLGKALDGWEGERWLDIRSAAVRDIMKSRLELAKNKGCDGVEPDNVDGYDNDSGFPLTYGDQIDYNRFLAEEAHRRGLAVALKNDLDQIEALEPSFDFALNEECHTYDECDRLKPFIDAGKPVFHVEYDRKYIDDANQRQALCDESNRMGFRTLILPLDLDNSYRHSCQ